MEIIIIVVIALIIIWVLFFRDITPSNKSDEQLKYMYERASSNFYKNPGYSKQLEILTEEMEKRGLLGEKKQETIQLTESEQKKLDEANRIFEESKLQEKMHKLFEDGIPELIFKKTIEIAKTRNISEHEASKIFNEMFESASLKYKNKGMPQKEADDKALYDVVNTEIPNA